MTMRRTDIHEITFTLRCESGLHIGGSQDELKIGGSDNPVIKNPATGRAYVPGSSLKGKMRAELEKQLGKFGGSYERAGTQPCGCARNDCPVCRMFGAHMNTGSQLGSARIIVRDGRLAKGGELEDKSENIVNRKRGAAEHPRSNERVAEGSEFDMKVVLQVYKMDENFSYKSSTRKTGGNTYTGPQALQAIVADCLYLVESTALGGGTSRGSGEVSFHNFQLDGQPWTLWSN